MTAAPDPASLTAPKDPAAYRTRPLMGLGFWALLSLCILCVLAGVALASFAPRLLGARPSTDYIEASPAAEAPLPAASPLAVNGPHPPGPAAAAPEYGRLDARVSALEGHDRTVARAAAAALAASALLDATRGSGPFAQELAALRAAAPDVPELAGLSRLAETGALSRAALAASFPDYAARAASAARAPGSGASLSDRMGHLISRIVSVRRVAEAEGAGPDALLARAERQVEDGDVERALRTLDQLPPAAREAMAPWRIRAERRAEIDRQAAALRTRALQALSQASGAAP